MENKEINKNQSPAQQNKDISAERGEDNKPSSIKVEEGSSQEGNVENVQESGGQEEKKEQARTTLAKSIFLRVFAQTMGTLTVGYEKAGVSHETVRRWKMEDPDFLREYNRVVEKRNDDVQDRLFKLIQQDDGPSVRYYLDRKHPEFKPKQVTEIVTGDRTLEDLLYESAQKKQNGDKQIQSGAPAVHADERRTEGQPPVDQEQARGEGEVQGEQKPDALPEKEDPTKPGTEGEAAGTQ